MKHAHDDDRLSAHESEALQQIQAGPQGGETVPVTREFLRWLSGARAPEAAPAANGKALPARTADQADAKEEQIDGTLFAKGAGDASEVDINDVQQGQVGDCYFVAVLAAIARVNPDFIKSMVKDNGDGTYTVTFHTKQGFSGLFGSRSNQSVTVDSKFWTDGKGNPVYAKKGDTDAGGKPELWVMVIEKAWAKLHGSYDDINGSKVDDDARQAVTGKDVDYIDPDDLSDAELTKKIEAAWAAKQPVIFWSLGDEKSKKLTKNGVVADHEYALNAAGGGKFTLYNPWGYQHLTDVDAAFIKTNFQKIRFLTL